MPLAKVQTSMGMIWFSYTGEGLHSLAFPPGPCSRGLPASGPTPEGPGPWWLPLFKENLKVYLEGGQVDFTPFPVDFRGISPFQTAVLKETRRIPYGRVAWYGFLADAVGAPGAARAVGTCMGRNRLPLVVPCHRVIKKTRDLGGFGPGVHWKKHLLELEGVPVEGLLTASPPFAMINCKVGKLQGKEG